MYVIPLLPHIGSNCVVALHASSQADLVVPIPGIATVVVVLWVVTVGLVVVELSLGFPSPHPNPPIETAQIRIR